MLIYFSNLNLFSYKYFVNRISVNEVRNGALTTLWQRWDSNPRPRRDWCLKPAPWTARPRYRYRLSNAVNFFDKIMDKKQIQDIVHIDRFRGAMVARLTPDQEVACSSHVGIRGVGANPYQQLGCQNQV